MCPGSVLIDYIVGQAIKMGYPEISIGVDKSNSGAVKLYLKRGFTEVLCEDEDEHGPYLKLLKRLTKAPQVLHPPSHNGMDFPSRPGAPTANYPCIF